MKALIYQPVLIVHVLCGFFGLLSGFVAMIARRKGGLLHKRAGVVFYWAMFGIFVTTLIFFVLDPTNLRYQFFLGIGIVSFYPAFSGKRVLAMKKGLTPNWLDKTAMWLVGLCGLVMIGYAILGRSSGYSVLFGIFGAACLSNFYGDYKVYSDRVEADKMHWFFAHGGKMTGAFSAAMTAFCVNIVPRYLPHNLPEYLYIAMWVFPGVLIGFWGQMILKKYRKTTTTNLSKI
jgi:uncharacterized membrane protein